VAPLATIIAAAGVLIEVTILAASAPALPRNAAEKSVLQIVTRAETVWVIRVDKIVAVVVNAVSTCINVILTGAYLAPDARLSGSASPRSRARTSIRQHEATHQYLSLTCRCHQHNQCS
jgi:hypothetical protein